MQVTVCLITYNHARYISKTLDSILAQKTSFNWRLTVYDDHSTDGTAEILKQYALQYPAKVHLHIQETNVGAVENWKQMLQSASTDYIAYIEGDDYWIDELKLETQYAILNRRPSVGLVYAQALQIAGEHYIPRIIGKRHTRCTLCLRNDIPALTTMFRKECLDGFFEELSKSLLNWKMGDYPLWLWIAQKWDIEFIERPVGVYRVHGTSASRTSGKQEWLASRLAILRYFRLTQQTGRRRFCYRVGAAMIITEMTLHAARSIMRSAHRSLKPV